MFLFYPYVNKNSKFPSMRDLLTVIENATGKKGTAYNAQTDDDIVKQLKNVNSTWSTQDFIITNTKITVGVNYDNLFSIFDMVFLSIAGFNTSRDIIQVSMRCRALKEKLIKVVLLESQNTFNTFENDDIKVDNCPIYQNLVKDILIEKQAPLQQSFQFLCQKAGYKLKVNNSILRTDLEAYFTKYYADCNLAYSYDTIPDIDSIQSEEITQRIFESKATLEDKISQKKYFYKMQFTNANSEELSIGWDKRYSFFFDKIKLIIHEAEENLYFKIQEFNKWDSIFPEDAQLNKVKLNDELVDEIFKQYHFKDLTKASKPKAIIKNIYNSYFGKNIINSCTDNNKHYKLTIKDETRMLYHFSLNNLKARNTNEYEFSSVDMFNDGDLPEDKEEEVKPKKKATRIILDFNNF